MVVSTFRDRCGAGRVLAARLGESALVQAGSDPLVLGLPAGGVIVAAEVAEALELPLDVLVVRRFAVPWRPELGVGAVAGRDLPVYDKPALRRLATDVKPFTDAVARERSEVRARDRLLRAGHPEPRVRGRTVIVVDDGMMTGLPAYAALRWLRQRGCRDAVVAAPVGSPHALALVSRVADQVVCPMRPSHVGEVREWYQEFRHVSDADVVRALRTVRPEWALDRHRPGVPG